MYAGSCRRFRLYSGKGPLEDEVAALPNVENRGFLSGTELYQTIAEASFVVFPSECYENCPFSVMEAQLHKTPVIASKIGGIPELLQDGKTGELFPVGDSSALQKRIEELWKDSKRLQTYTVNCEKVSFMSAETYCEKLLQIYGGLKA